MADPTPPPVIVQPPAQPVAVSPWAAIETRVLTMLVTAFLGWQARSCNPQPEQPAQPVVVTTPAPVVVKEPPGPAPVVVPTPMPIAADAKAAAPSISDATKSDGVNALVKMAMEKGPQVIDLFEAATKTMIADARARVAKK